MENKNRKKMNNQLDDYNEHTAGGHPLKKLKEQTFEDFEREFARYDKPCVQLVNKRPTEPPKSEKAMTN